MIEETAIIGTATYSPEDNKLRIYPFERLDSETYSTLRESGFKWAPKQELFVAPMWTPDREDLVLSLCGEIGDESLSLEERQAERSERFLEYKEKRMQGARQAREGVERITENIPLGQPILVGHHSERKARKHAEQIQRGMEKALNQWETANYWKSRAIGALRHASYKAQPGVRARRIKGLEAEKRKIERDQKEIDGYLKAYSDPKAREAKHRNIYTGETGLFLVALIETNGSGISWEERNLVEKDGSNLDEMIEKAKGRLATRTARNERWLNHLENRLTFEKELLEASGASSLLEKPKRAKQPPLLNYKAETIDSKNRWHRTREAIGQVEMNKANYARIENDYKGTGISWDGTHRFRFAMVRSPEGKLGLYAVFLTDSKAHPIPQAKSENEVKATEEIKASAIEETIAKVERQAKVSIDTLEDESFENLRDFKAPEPIIISKETEFFPTPPEVGEKLCEIAGVSHFGRILEPSAGNGALMKAILDYRLPNGYHGLEVLGVEKNPTIFASLEKTVSDLNGSNKWLAPESFKAINRDFLELTPDDIGMFGCIVMNPPFSRGQDVEHVLHALDFLSAGGVLVAVVSPSYQFNQQRKFADFRETLQGYEWEEEKLPEGSFKASGTSVNTVILRIKKPAAKSQAIA